MKNAMSLKAIMKNLAHKKHISAQLVLQNFMLERLLERVSLSRFKDNFILKGGFLIASMVGLDTRATMVLDEALTFTAQKRGTAEVMINYLEIMHVVEDSPVMIKFWQDYQKSFEYAKSVGFGEACQAVVEIMDKLRETRTR